MCACVCVCVRASVRVCPRSAFHLPDGVHLAAHCLLFLQRTFAVQIKGSWMFSTLPHTSPTVLPAQLPCALEGLAEQKG